MPSTQKGHFNWISLKKVHKNLTGSAGEVLCEKKLIEGFLRGRAGIVWGFWLMRFPFGGHFVDAIHAKGAFQLSFCRYFRQKLFVLNLYVSMIDKSHRPKSHFLGWNTSLTRKITKDIDKYHIWNICHRKKTTTNPKSERGKLFILLLLLSLLSFFMFDFYFSASRPCFHFRNKHPVWGW